MPTRDVTVRLSAKVDAYVAAMGRAKTATGALSADSVRNLDKVGSSMQRLGRSASLYATAPIVALGVASVGAASNFERSFSEMVGLANVPASEVEHLQEAVLSLAGETAKAPQELADALYFAASAGLDSAAAMDVLDHAARASAAGMGDTSSIVGLVAGAVAAYGPEVLSAADATDILTAAIREGRSDPQELAGALGRVTPIAAAMGISFGETAGAAAYMSNIIGNTDETITALRGVMLAMLDPSKQGKDALLSIGTSADELKAAIAEDGLVGAFELLRTHGLDPNSDAMSNLFEDNRALNGAMILLNDETGRLQPIIDAVTNSTGSLSEAFAAVADDDGFKMRQALVDLQVAMLTLGDLLIPIVASMAESLAGLARAFTDLPEPVQQLITVFGGLIALGGPTAIFAGSVLRNFGTISTAFDKTAASTGRVGRAMGLLGVVVGTAYAAWQILDGGHLNAQSSLDTTSDALSRATYSIIAESVAAAAAGAEVDSLTLAHTALSRAISETADDALTDALGSLNIEADRTLEVLLAIREGGNALEGPTIASQLAEDFFGMEEAVAMAFIALGQTGAETEEMAAAFNLSEEAVQDFYTALSTVEGFAFEQEDEVARLAEQFLDATATAGGFGREAVLAAEKVAGLRTEGNNAIDVYIEFIRTLAEMTPAERENAEVTDEMRAAFAALPPELQAGMAGLDGFGYSTDQVQKRQADAIDTMSNYMDAVEDTNQVISFYVDAIGQVFTPLANFERAQMSVWDAALGFTEAIDDESHSIEMNTQAGLTNRGAILDWADQILGLATAGLEAGRSVEHVTGEFEHNIDALLDGAEAAGFNRQKVEDLLETYGLTPASLNTAINLAGDALAKWRVDRYLEKLDEIPEEEAVLIEALIDEGDYAEAKRRLDNIPDQTVWVQVSSNVASIANQIRNLTDIGVWAEGGYINGAQFGVVGEAGPEVILPLTNAGRMAELLAMPQVRPAVMAAMGNISAPSAMGTLNSIGSTQQDMRTINIYVYNHGRRELTGTDVETALVNALSGRR